MDNNNKKTSILIVEDDVLTAKTLEKFLQDTGYNSAGIVQSGLDALNFLEKTLPDLILMDIKLQGEMDGIETAQSIYHKFKLPIVFVTARADKETIDRSKMAHPFGYIVKPITNEQMLQASIEIALHNFILFKQSSQETQDIKNYFTQIKNIVFSKETIESNLINKNNVDVSKRKRIYIQKTNFTEINSQIERISDFFNIVGNSERFKILHYIRFRHLSTQDLQESLQKSLSTISHHMKKIQDINLVYNFKNGKNIEYRMNKDTFLELQKALISWCSCFLNSDYTYEEEENLMKEESNLIFIQTFLEILSNPERFEMIQHIFTKCATISELELSMRKSQSTISHHIKVLEEITLIKGLKSGKYTEFSVDEESIKKFIRLFNAWSREIEKNKIE